MTRTARPWFLVIVACVMVIGAGCSSAESSGHLRDAQRLLTDYVTALASGDIDAAMRQRCNRARVSDQDKPTFASQASRLIEELGPITLDGVRQNDPPAGLRPLADLPDPLEVTYRLSVNGTGVPGDLLTVVVSEDGTPRLCGFATAEADAVRSSLPKQVADAGGTERDPQGLMPAAPGPDYRQVADDAEVGKPGVTAAWSRAWQTGEYGGARVTARTYQSAEEAGVAAREAIDAVASESIERFDVAGVPPAVGERFLAYAWLWIQPPSAGPFIDQVVMRFGQTVVVAAVSNLPTDSPHSVATNLASEVLRLAHP